MESIVFFHSVLTFSNRKVLMMTLSTSQTCLIVEVPGWGALAAFPFTLMPRVENIYFILKECLKRTKVDWNIENYVHEIVRLTLTLNVKSDVLFELLRPILRGVLKNLWLTHFIWSHYRSTKKGIYGFLLSRWVTTSSIPWLKRWSLAEAEVKGYFTNHSLLATTVSRLSREGVDDKLIRGVTRHWLEALQSYKRETDEQLVRVFKLVQGPSSDKTPGKFCCRANTNSFGGNYFECFWWKL